MQPRLTTLRLAALAPDRFEEFTTDVAALLFPGAQVHRWGTQGYKQHGIDVIVQRGGVNLATFQCKRRESFGPRDVRAAIEAVGIEAEQHFLFLTRGASPAARREIGKYDNWQLWDIDDISRVIRSERVDLDGAVRLIDTYFPGWREPFLGVREPGPWLTSAEFYQAFSGDRLFTQDTPLFGRDEELAAILSFLDDGGPALALLVGRGGIGKTRMLRSIAEMAMSTRAHEVRFLAGSSEVRPEQFELLPAGPKLLVIVDDVHERTDLEEFLRSINLTRPGANVLLALRPYGITALSQDFRRVGIHPSEIPTWTLENLKATEAESIARSVLGPGANEGIVQRLARVGTDCPLITVVGAGLVKRNRLEPERLEGDSAIRTEILQAFRDTLVADPATGNPELTRAVLDAVAILQPVHLSNVAFRSALEFLTGAPMDRVARHLSGLEDAGVLLRRGTSLRIVPDLLGDVVLSEASFDHRSGIGTGFIERAHQAASGDALQHVFVNASRVDWQIHLDHPPDSSLVDALWDVVQQEFQAADIQGRLGILRLLKRVALYQPNRAMALVRWVMDHPAHSVGAVDGLFAKLYTHRAAEEELATILRYVAHGFELLPEAANLLWELAAGDSRRTNQYPDHPIRVLRDLASYSMGKPLVYNEAIVDAAESWFAADGLLNRAHSPFDVLAPLLVTEGADNSWEGMTIQFRPYGINVEAVRALRQRVLDLAFKEVKHLDLRRAIRAVAAIAEALHYPHGVYGRAVDAEERDVWTPLFVETISRLGKMASDRALDPLVAVALHQALYWHARYSNTETQRAAQTALGRLPSSMEHRLALALHDGWGRLMFDHPEDYQASQDQKQRRFDELAEDIIRRWTTEEAVAHLRLDLNAERRSMRDALHGETGSPGPFVWTLVSKSPEIGKQIYRAVAMDPDDALVDIVPVALGKLAETDPQEMMKIAQDLLAVGSADLTRSVALAFGWNRGSRPLAIGEMELLRKFAAYKDPHVRQTATRAAQLLADQHRAEAVDLISTVQFQDSTEVAEEVFAILGPHGPLSWDDLSTEQAEAMLNQLQACPSLEDYHLTALLSEVSRQHPDRVWHLLQRRIERSEQGASVDEFHAVPFHWANDLNARGHRLFEPILRDIIDWIAADPESWQRRKMGGEVFRAFALQFDQPVIALLEAAVGTGSRNLLDAVAAVVAEAPRALMWNVDFVRRLLNASLRYGEEATRLVRSALYAAMISGVRSGTPGEPFPEDVEQRDRAAQFAERLRRGSEEERFYRSLVQSAEENIRWHAEHDDKLLDGRVW